MATATQLTDTMRVALIKGEITTLPPRLKFIQTPITEEINKMAIETTMDIGTATDIEESAILDSNEITNPTPEWLAKIYEDDEDIELVKDIDNININAIKCILQILKTCRPSITVPYLELGYLERARLEQWAEMVITVIYRLSEKNRLCVPEREIKRAGLTSGIVNYMVSNGSWKARAETFGKNNQINPGLMTIFSNNN